MRLTMIPGDEYPSAQILGVDLSPTQPNMCDSPLNLPGYEKKTDLLQGPAERSV